MDDFELPDDLKNDVEVIYLDEDEEIEDDMEADNEEPEEPVEDQAKVTFKGHTGPIYSSALSKDNKVAITGGQDDMAYVWSVETGELLYECTGHKDSVTAVEFNRDGKLVVTADMGGLIQVWSVEEKNLLWCNEGDDMLFLFWHFAENILITGTQAGEVYIWQVPQGNCKVLPSHGSAATCAKLLNDGKRILVGYENGILKLWDIKTTSIIWQTEEHMDVEIHTVEVNESNTLAVVGPQGDCFKLADGKMINSLKCPEGGEIEAIVFNTELNAVITGTSLGGIYVWDLGRSMVRHKINLEKYIISFEWGNNGKLLVGCLDGKLHVCDVRTGCVVGVLTGHTSEILSMKASSDGNFVLTTSEDKTAKIFAINS